MKIHTVERPTPNFRSGANKKYIELGGWQAWEYKIRKQDKATDSWCIHKVLWLNEIQTAQKVMLEVSERSAGAQGVVSVQNSRN